jgi:hypothetical protein
MGDLQHVCVGSMLEHTSEIPPLTLEPSVASQFYLLPPLKCSPATPFPTNPAMTSQPRTRGRSGETLSSSPPDNFHDMNNVSWFISQLRATFNQVFLIYRDGKSQSGSLAFALSKYHQILQLADKLPAPAIRQGQASSSSLFSQ